MKSSFVRRWMPAGVLCMLLFTLPLTGCFVGSLQPLYHASDPIFEKNLLGIWALDSANDKDQLIITRDGERQYVLVYLTDNAATAYDVRLVEIGKTRYLDVYPHDAARRSADAHYFPTHSIWKMTLDGATLKLNSMNEDWLKEQIDNQAAFVEGMKVGDDVVLTFKTTALQEFVRGNSDRLFEGEAGVWKRKQ